MRTYCFILAFSLFSFRIAFAQKSMQKAPVSITYAQNGVYSVKSFSYDQDFPTLKGKSIVYKTGKEMYTIDRSFDLYNSEKYSLVISNNGAIIAYFTNDVYSREEECKKVTIYRNGKLVKSYDLVEFTGYNPDETRCYLFYDNFSDVVDIKKSNYGTANYQKVFKEHVSEQEKFLNENFIVVSNDTIYATDSRRIVTIFDLKNLKVISRSNFDEVYPKVKDLRRPNSEITYFDVPYQYIQNLVDKNTGKPFSAIISELSGLKFVDIKSKDFFKYTLNRVEMSGYLDHNGKFEIEALRCDEKLDAKQIENFVAHNLFVADFVPTQIEKQYLKHFYGGYRNPNDSIAEQETALAKEKKQRAFQARMTLDTIEGVYIPKNLEDCFIQLDKILKTVDKEDIKKLESRSNMISYHMGLGLWMRNNWGLWGGSRLLKYFKERGVSHPDSMSSIILYNYYDWLKGNKEVGKDWEEKTPAKKLN
jgi:hypothetical protein